MFTSGITDLAPELVGWHGEPGIVLSRTTDLFLVGDNFSVHETHVIAGGKYITPTVVSRQILLIEVPAGVSHSHGHVDIHVSTPYGVSGHVEVPVVAETAPLCVFQWTRDLHNAEVIFKIGADNKATVVRTTVVPPRISIDAPTSAMPSTAKVTMTFYEDRSVVPLNLPGSEVGLALDAATVHFVVSDAGQTALEAAIQKIIQDQYLKDPARIPPSVDLAIEGVLSFATATTIGQTPPVERRLLLHVNLRQQ
jgi:hypothetical protein